MMDEKQLKAMVEKYSEARLDAVESSQQEHEFSPRFQRQMKRVMGRKKYRPQFRTIKAAVSMATVAVLLVLTSPIKTSVQADCTQWLRTNTGGAIRYHYTGTQTTEPMPHYELGYIPEGYVLEEARQEDKGGGYAYYADWNACILDFSYFSGWKEYEVTLFVPESEHSIVSIGGISADLYMTYSNYANSMIVWSDPETDVLFTISYDGNEEEMLHLARSVRKK